MAEVARNAPRVESGDLAGILQGPHGRQVDSVRAIGARGAVLRVDRQHHQAARWPAVCPEVHSAAIRQQMVGDQSPTLARARGSRPPDPGGTERGTDPKRLRAAAPRHPGATRILREGAEVQSARLGVLSRPGAELQASLCGLDSHRQAAGNAAYAHSRSDRAAGRGEYAGPEV